jgi:hypothetical protein
MMAPGSVPTRFGEISSIRFTPDEQRDEVLDSACVWHGRLFAFMMDYCFMMFRSRGEQRSIWHSERHPEAFPETAMARRHCWQAKQQIRKSETSKLI